MLAHLRTHLVQVALGIGVVLFFLMHSGGGLRLAFVDRLENLAYDTRLVLTMPGTRDERIVIVDIDEKSLAAEGRWPWGRDKLARMVVRLFEEQGAGLVGFDVVFAEPDDSSGLSVLEGLAAGELADVEPFQAALQRLRPQLDNDALFADALARYPVVLGYYFSDTVGASDLAVGALPPPVLKDEDFAGRRIPFMKATGYGANLEPLQRAALGAGHFNPAVDEDGVVRRVPLLYAFQGGYYEALALAMARLAVQVTQVEPGFPADSRPGGTYQGIEWLQIGERVIPVDESVRALVPYRGRQGSFAYVSATDVLNGSVPPDSFRGRIVLVGTSAPGLLDLRSTPVQNVYPGVEVHANLIAGILDGDIKMDPAYTLGAEFIILLACGLLLALALPLVSPLLATVVFLVSLTAYAGLNFWVWSAENIVFAVAPGLLMISALYLLNMSYGFFVESRGKRQLAGLFGQYIPPELVDEMSVDPTRYSMVAESREMSVLFTDVRGFTTISEGLDPRELAELMSEFLTPMTEVIHQHRGTIDKYMGDAVMCFWGAPLRDPDHARHALLAGLDMLRTVSALAPIFQARGWPEVRIGVGISTGIMSVGDMGSRFRRAYTVLGDAVNLGARLEGQTKNYGVELIVHEGTREAAPEFAYRELDRIRVKGKDEPVTIYEPLGLATEVDEDTRKELQLYAQALKLYRTQQWDGAEIQFLNLARQKPERYLYTMYARRVAGFRREPPGEGWDGVYTHTTK